jgi:hypothetical protein
MNPDDLKPKQFETMRNEVGKRMRYLQRLEEHVYALGLAREDELFQLVLAANKANQTRWVKLH